MSTVQQLCDRLTELCHAGHFNEEVIVRVLDGYYKVGSIDKVEVYSKSNKPDKTLFAIEATTVKRLTE